MPSPCPHISWASERHLRIEVGDDLSPSTHARVQAVVHAIAHANPASFAILDIIPAYATVLLALDLNVIAEHGAPRIEAAIRQAIDRALHRAGPGPNPPDHPSRLVDVPVCYAPAFALDLHDVATALALTPRDVIRLHTGARYVVHFVGFSPGFAYLGGLPKQLESPRLDKPRTRVPAGSVAIAGSQAGVYPHATPGGWRILGRTPLSMFDPRREPPSLLAMGDRVRFVEISEHEFLQIERDQRPQPSHPHALDRSSTVAAPSHAPSRASDARGPQIRVLDPGLFTTIQDLGRPGHAASGVPESGAADPSSLRLANLLLGNPPDSAALEMTLRGGEYEFTINTQLCVVGAVLPLSIHVPGAQPRPAPVASPIHVRAGERLRIGFATSGARAYLAVPGGIDVPRVLSSRSTLVNAALGGIDGRPLQPGDTLRFGSVSPVDPNANPPRSRSFASPDVAPASSRDRILRVVHASHTHRFSPDALAAFAHAEFIVASNSDRMGLRLQGPPITPPGGGRLLSEGMMWGALQITENGQPIILMPDHPTTGGYPIIACVIADDLPRLGQLRPNDRLRFAIISLDQARDAWTPHEPDRARSPV